MTSTPRFVLAATLLGVAITAAARADDNRALARLRAMGRVLADAKRLAVTIDAAYDVVQTSGERIEFGEWRMIVLKRPDHARIDVTRRDGAKRGLVFDGAQLTLFDTTANIYATLPLPGTTDAAFAHMVDVLDMRVPLRELLRTDLPRQLKDLDRTARLVAEEQLGGVATDHVALRGDMADLQLWIPRDGDPLPKRIAITYRLAFGAPQFEADLAWDLAPATPDELFAFTPAAGAEAIPVEKPGAEPRP